MALRRTGTGPTPHGAVPAYREAGVIGAKVEDVRAKRLPGALDIVVADGAETAAAAELAGARP